MSISPRLSELIYAGHANHSNHINKPSSRAAILESTQSLPEMGTRNIAGGKG
jgi:hypothetical protein